MSRLLAVMALLPAPLFAEDAGLLTAETTGHRYQDEDNQWVPYSITVIKADELADNWYWELADLEGQSPLLVVDPMALMPRGAAISLRGVGSTADSLALFPTVPVIVDGVYSGTHASQNPVLFDTARVEVKRGPAGAFTSAPAIGGAIRLYRNQPADILEARSEITVGSHDRVRLAGMVNVPVGDRFAARASMTWESGGDFVDNESPVATATGRTENEEERLDTTLSMRFDATEALSLRYTWDLVRDDSDVPARLNLSTPADLVCSPPTDHTRIIAANCSLNRDGLLPETASFDVTTQNFPNNRDYDVDQHALHIDFDAGNYTISSITSFRDTMETAAHDLDGTWTDVYSKAVERDYEQFTQEFTVSGDYSERAGYAAGFFYMSNEYTMSTKDIFVLDVLDGAGRILPVDADRLRTVDAFQDMKLTSLFLSGDYAVSDKWTLDAGVRWTDVDRGFTSEVTRLLSDDPSPAPVEFGGDTQSAETTGTVGASYRVDDEAMVYMRLSRDFRPVGFYDNANSAEAAPYTEEAVDSAELGLKTEWFDDRLRINYVTFRNRWRDKRELIPTRLSSGRIESVLEDVARVEIRGHELELEALPIDSLRLRAVLGHQNADYDHYLIPSLTPDADPVDRSGLIPLFAPADMFGLSGTYTRPMFDGVVRFFGSYRFTTEYWTDSLVPAGKIDNFTIIDLSVDYTRADWRLRLFMRNVNDKRYLINASRPVDADIVSLAPGFTSTVGITTTAQPSEPAFWGLEVTWAPKWSR